MISRESSITVVIPVWDDYVAFLPDAVDSITRDAPDAAVVVVDNASRVTVPELPGTSVVRAPQRLSVGAARNLGVWRARTEYIVVLDADDKLLEGTLGFLESRMRADDSLSACATSLLEGDTGRRHRTPRRFVPALSRLRRVFALAHCVWSLYPIQGCTLMRTEQVRAAGGYADAGWGDDWVLAVSLAFRGRIEVHRRLGLIYRGTQGSLWRTPKRSSELVASARLVRDRIRSDPAAGRGVKAALPLLAALQLAAVYVLRPAFLAARRLRRTS